ncbi:hypothetical protein HK097_003689, partial [Rhizophlyctis rosea]
RVSEETDLVLVTDELAAAVQELARKKQVIGEYESLRRRKGGGVIVRYEDNVYNIRIDDDTRLLCVQDLQNTDLLWGFGYYDEE